MRRIHMFITGAILIALGVLTLKYPLSAIMTVGTFIGIGLVVSGINYLSGFWFFRFKRFILLGLLDIIAGSLMIARPGITSFVLPFVIGLWLFMEGISRMGVSLWLGGAKVKGWWLMLLNGAILIALSALMCASPIVGSLSIMMVLACALIASGVLAVLEGIIMF